MWLLVGEIIKEEVRDFFKAGLKSGNKIYHISPEDLRLANPTDRPLAGQDPAVSWVNVALQKNSRRAKADAALVKVRAQTKKMSLVEEANVLVGLLPQDRAGNCKEMAVLAGWAVLQHGFLKPDHIFKGLVSGRGDHAFCLLTPDNLPPKTSFPTVRDFIYSEHAVSWIIIDPWLNVVCRVNHYLTAAGQKFEKWGGAGKRVWWDHGKVGPTWYPPQGEYRDVFGKAPLILTPFG